MRKRTGLIILLAVLLFCGYFLIEFCNRDVQLVTGLGDMPLKVTVKADNTEQCVYPWHDEEWDVYYFFLPSFVNDSRIFLDEIGKSGIEIDEQLYKWGSSFEWEAGEVYSFKESESDVGYRICFMKSENLPAFFVSTDSGSMEYLRSNKDNEESGKLTVITEDGNVGYNGSLDKISGRGNSTWDQDKKPYSIKLPKAYSLCNMDAGKKWNLLAMYFESDKIHSKLVYDMARELQMDYAIQSTWVDLYCNGEYSGLYLLTEAVTVGEGRVEIHELTDEDSDISGGYFLEKKMIDPENTTSPFISTEYAMFTVHSPKQINEEQQEYISGYMRWIERTIVSGDPEYRDCIDVKSFADHLVLENIALDEDGMVISTFFYKNKGNDKLYLGPVWDYDRSMGEGYQKEYESPVFMVGMQEWYQPLYEDDYFRKVVMSEYQNLRPYLQYVLDEQIDQYADEIRASVAMDRMIGSAHKDSEMKDYDVAIENLKDYLAGRLEYLDGLWGSTP